MDAAGEAYVAESTNSTEFPTENPLQAVLGAGDCDTSTYPKPCRDAFVAKVNPAGTALQYATYLGDTYPDEAYAIAVDAAGDAHVA